MTKFDASGNHVWSTYYGGSGNDLGNSIDVDGAGNVVIAGNTQSTDFPVAGAFQPANNGNNDAFIAKLDGSGNQLWSTYHGGSGDEYGYGIATDGAGNIVITGTTNSTNYPVSAGAFQASNAGGEDAFVVKYDASGSRLWSTYCGGSLDEEGWGVATDISNNIYVCGDTYSGNFPATFGAFQTSHGGGLEDNYMVKFDPAGNQVCGTFLGGTGHDEMQHRGHINIGAGYIYMAGYAWDNYPVTPGAYQTVNGGGGKSDAWIAQFCDDCTLTCPIPPLAIELSYFIGENIGKTNILKWQTATETNNDRIEIERSFDGKNFENIGEVAGAGNSNSHIKYSFTDNFPLKEINHYRLKQVDFDGQFTYSNTIAIKVSSKELPIEYMDLYGRKIISSQSLRPGVYIQKQGDHYKKTIIHEDH